MSAILAKVSTAFPDEVLVLFIASMMYIHTYRDQLPQIQSEVHLDNDSDNPFNACGGKRGSVEEAVTSVGTMKVSWGRASATCAGFCYTSKRYACRYSVYGYITYILMGVKIVRLLFPSISGSKNPSFATIPMRHAEHLQGSVPLLDLRVKKRAGRLRRHMGQRAHEIDYPGDKSRIRGSFFLFHPFSQQELESRSSGR